MDEACCNSALRSQGSDTKGVQAASRMRRPCVSMKILKLGIGETFVLAPGVRITVLSVIGDCARLQIDAPAHVSIAIGDAADTSAGMGDEKSSGRNGS